MSNTTDELKQLIRNVYGVYRDCKTLDEGDNILIILATLFLSGQQDGDNFIYEYTAYTTSPKCVAGITDGKAYLGKPEVPLQAAMVIAEALDVQIQGTSITSSLRTIKIGNLEFKIVGTQSTLGPYDWTYHLYEPGA